MKTEKKNTNTPLILTKDSSLAHLAFGHEAFRAWRKIKENSNNEK